MQILLRVLENSIEFNLSRRVYAQLYDKNVKSYSEVNCQLEVYCLSVCLSKA